MRLEDTEQTIEELYTESNPAPDSLQSASRKNKTSQKAHKKKSNGSATSNIVLGLITILALSCLLFVLITDQLNEKEAKEVSTTPSASPVYTKEQLDMLLEDARVEAMTETEDKLKSELLTAFQGGGSVIATLREMYPEYLIFYDGDHYSFSPIDTSLPLNEYAAEGFTQHENGEITYHSNGIPVSVKGIDISKYQGEIDWTQVAGEGIEYAMIRGGIRGYGTGALVADENFAVNAEGAINAGIGIGTYFFTQAVNEQEAIEEADFLLELIAPYSITYPVVLDVEIIHDKNARTAALTCEQRTKNAIAFLERVREKGYTPMIYGNLKTFTQMLDMKQLTQYQKWVAFYDTYLYFPYEVNMWQYSDTAEINGIEGRVDLNIMFPAP